MDAKWRKWVDKLEKEIKPELEDEGDWKKIASIDSGKINNFVSKESGFLDLAFAIHFRMHRDSERSAFAKQIDDRIWGSSFEEEFQEPVFEDVASDQAKIEPDLTISRSRGHLHYAHRFLPVTGRTAESKKLERFTNNQPGFRWMQVSGSAGQGKSRLALELVLGLQDTWYAGFLSGDKMQLFSSHWQYWQPDKPTLMVVDYVLGIEKSLKIAIQALASRAEQFREPVCLLLVERQRWDKGRIKNISSHLKQDSPELNIPSGRAEWFLSLCNQKFGDGDTILGDSKFEDGVVDLSSLPEPDLVNIVYSLSEKMGCSIILNEKIISDYLRRIDPTGSPLFAYFLAEALISNQFQPAWHREDLLEYTLQRDMEVRWSSQLEGRCPLLGEDTLSMRLAVVAAMTEELDCRKVKEFFHPEKFNNDIVRQALVFSNNHIGAGAAVHTMIEGLKPDILGEWFVLSCLSGFLNLQKIANIAWELEPNKMMAFLQRCAHDFPSHPIAQELIGFPPNSDSAHAVFVENATALSASLFSAKLHHEFPEHLKSALLEAAEFNSVSAAMIGYCYLAGFVFPQDEAHGVKYFQKAAALKNNNAMYNMGVINLQGIHCTPDPEEAVRWWSEAALAGDTASMYNLAMSYKNGQGVDQSTDLYWEWMQRSADNGDREAMATIGYHYELGVGVELNEEIALKWYKASWIRAEDDEYPDVAIYSPLHHFASTLV
jgi:hypothetical protein